MITETISLLGALCFLIASIGLWRLPDAISKIHAATKASSLGILLLCAAAFIYFFALLPSILLVLIAVFVFLTAPLACQTIARQVIRKRNGEQP